MRSTSLVTALAVALSPFPLACSSSEAPSAAATSNAQAGADAAVDTGAGDAAPPLDATAPPPGCAEYCTALLACNEVLEGQYPALDTCLKECALFTVGTTGDTGNTLGCRWAHAQRIASAPATECAIAGPTGGGVCGTRCDAFCTLAVAACGDSWNGGCASACAGWTTLDGGPHGEESGDSLDCREAEVQSAFVWQKPDASTGCPSVGSDSAECR